MDKKILYGPYCEIWGHYTGNEEALLSLLPIFSSDEKFYCATDLNWAFDEKKENVLEMLERDLEYFIPYNPISKARIEISSGQMVLQAGPKYWESLEAIFLGNDSWSSIGEEWIEVQDGFKICLKFPGELDYFKKKIGGYAIEKFDSELKAANCKYISQTANAALEIFSSYGMVENMQRFYRMTITAMVSNNQEWYNRILKVSSIEYDKPVEVLDRLVHEFYEEKYCM